MMIFWQFAVEMLHILNLLGTAKEKYFITDSLISLNSDKPSVVSPFKSSFCSHYYQQNIQTL